MAMSLFRDLMAPPQRGFSSLADLMANPAGAVHQALTPKPEQMRGQPGEKRRGPDGKLYQYVQKSGGSGYDGTGEWDWSEVSEPLDTEVEGGAPAPASATPRMDRFKENFGTMFSPENAGAWAAMAGGKTFSDSLGGFIAASGETISSKRQKNKTRALLEKKYPDLVEFFDAGVSIKDAWDMTGKGKDEIINAGDGRLYNPRTGKWITAPGISGKAPNVETFYDERGNPYKAQWSENGWQRVGHSKGAEGFEVTLPDGTVIQQGPFGKQDEKNVANRVDAARDASASGASLKQMAGVLRDANKRMGPGGFSGSLIGAVDDELTQYGVDVLPGDPSARAQMRSGGLEVALQQVGKTKGAISNAEMGLFMAAAPGMANTPEGNAALFDMIDAIGDRQIQRAQEMENWRATHNGSLDGFEAAWAGYVDANPLITKQGNGIGVNKAGAAVGGQGFRKTSGGVNWRPVSQ